MLYLNRTTKNSVNEYASKLDGVLSEYKQMVDGESLHKLIAIIIPSLPATPPHRSRGGRNEKVVPADNNEEDDLFRRQLIDHRIAGDTTNVFDKHNLKPVSALESMRKKGPDKDGKAWIIVDTPSNLNGLEFLFVVLVGLDESIDENAARKCKLDQSRIYRGMSRAHYGVFILNHKIEKSWRLTRLIKTTKDKRCH